MFNQKFAPLSLAVAALALLHGPASAAAPSFGNFGQIEFRSDPAALVGAVRTDLAAQIPSGSSVADARAVLGEAGARCRPAQADGSVRCRYYGTHFQGDGVEPVSWTVNLSTQGDKVQSFTVVRQPAAN